MLNELTLKEIETKMRSGKLLKTIKEELNLEEPIPEIRNKLKESVGDETFKDIMKDLRKNGNLPQFKLSNRFKNQTERIVNRFIQINKKVNKDNIEKQDQEINDFIENLNAFISTLESNKNA